MLDEEQDTFTNHTKQIVLAIVPVVTGTLSVIGSACIVYIILIRDGSRKLRYNYNNQKKNQQTYHRLLLAMSLSDILSSLRACTSTFAMPTNTPGVWMAMGNDTTCRVQGFFAQLGFSTTLYSACLALYFLLCITTSSRGGTIQPTMRRSSSSGSGTTSSTSRNTIKTVEPYMLVLPALFGIVTAFSGLFLDLYHPVKLGIGCWIASYPMGCNDDEDTPSEQECTSGEHAALFVWLFGGIVVIASLITVIVCMIMITWKVKRQIKRMEQQYAVVPEQNRPNESTATRLRQTSVQAALYIGSFVLVYLWSSINRLLENNGQSGTFFIFSLLAQIFFPLQGFFNFFIYIRPRYLALAIQYPESSMWWKWNNILRNPSTSGATTERQSSSRNIGNYSSRALLSRMDSRRVGSSWRSFRRERAISKNTKITTAASNNSTEIPRHTAELDSIDNEDMIAITVTDEPATSIHGDAE